MIAPELFSQFGLISLKSKTNIENVGKGKLVGRDVLHHHTLSVFSHPRLQSHNQDSVMLYLILLLLQGHRFCFCLFLMNCLPKILLDHL